MRRALLTKRFKGTTSVEEALALAEECGATDIRLHRGPDGTVRGSAVLEDDSEPPHPREVGRA